MIPNYQQFMRPLLEATYASKGKEVKLRDMTQTLADSFQLSEADRAEKLPSGKQTILDNRVSWAKTYLMKAGLLESTRRAHFQITARGIEALKDDQVVIDENYLRKFDEFVAFKYQKSMPISERPEVEVSIHDEATPDEALRTAYQKINESLSEELLTRTQKVTPDFFEQLLIELLLAMGYGGTGEGTAHALGKTGDNGIDGVIDQDPLGVDQIYIQAKRYDKKNNVGASDIRDFFGALNLKKAQKGIFITTSDFTASATQTAKDLGSRIVLINGKELARLMLRYNIGSRDEQVLYVKKIDEEFFES